MLQDMLIMKQDELIYDDVIDRLNAGVEAADWCDRASEQRRRNG